MKNSVILTALIVFLKKILTYSKSSYTFKVVEKIIAKLEIYFKNSLLYRLLIGNSEHEPRTQKSFIIHLIEDTINKVVAFFNNLYTKGQEGSLIISGIKLLSWNRLKRLKIVNSLSLGFRNSLIITAIIKAFVFDPEE